MKVQVGSEMIALNRTLRLRSSRAVIAALLLLLGLCSGNAGARGAAGNDTEGKVYLLVIPRLKFKDASIQDVVKYLRELSKKLDPRHEGVNFFLRLDPRISKASRPRITLEFRDIPLVEAVRYICMGAGMQYRVEKYAVVIADRTLPMEKMQTRFFSVKPGVLGSTRTRKALKPLDTISGDGGGNGNNR